MTTLLATALLLAEVSFNRDIRPIMSDTCFRCHGPDKSSRMANLRLDIREEALRPNRAGLAPIVPGDPERSHIVKRIFDTGARVMPPVSAHKALSDKQKQTIRQWVAEGARYEGHWAFQPVTRPAVPVSADIRGPVRNPIDSFVQARLAKEGLAASPEADRRTLLRRVTLDLTGLPPTPEETAAFLGDKDPRAYDRVVDRLLASPRFAERQAQLWLDAVRYADTCGFHGDNPFPAWPYRDYVLKAFRDNKPFDEFTREQLAGDLLPNATREQRVAAAYNRMNRTSAEGGIQPKEYLAKYGADRVRTTASVFLGATMGCAECHDHKFDPFSAKDFYSFKAFFADIKETGLVPDRGREAWGELLKLPNAEQEAKLADLTRRIDAIAKPAADPAFVLAKLDWKYQRPVAASATQAKIDIFNDRDVERSQMRGGSVVNDRVPGEGLMVVGGPNPDNETYTVVAKPGAGTWTAIAIEAQADESLPGASLGRGSDRFQLSEVEAEIDGKPLKLIWAAANTALSIHEYPAIAAIDGRSETSWGISTHGDARPLLGMWFEAPVQTTAESKLTIRLRHDTDLRRATIGRFRVAVSTAPLPNVSVERDRLEAERAVLLASVPTVVATVATEPSTTRILPRGNFLDDSGEVVEPAIPAVFGKLETAGRRATRLDLANWIVSKDNPLTPRVLANRMWRQFFGTGLSKVLDDLGSQGEWPVDPELLDWLAAEFVTPSFAAAGAHAWDVKHLTRTIVTSHAYRQSSAPEKRSEELDPENRLLSRQNRMRVDAENVRDVALAVSGLLKERFGGPSVRPYQPEGYLAALYYPKRDYSESRGDDLYRRGLYTFWQRTFPNPTMATFDAPSREECTVNRSNSNTPLQALTLLNDPTFVEAARVMAQQALSAGPSFDAQLTWSFRRALGRAPLAEERKVLTDLYRKGLAEFRARPQEAKKLLSIGASAPAAKSDPAQLAGLTLITRAILNLHETITRN